MVRCKRKKKRNSKATSSSNAPPARVWQPGIDSIEEGEELHCDLSAYDTLHAFQLGWPCLSFDIVRDDLGALRHEFPFAMYCVAGTQATTPSDNALIVAKLCNITGKKRMVKLVQSSEESSDSSSDDDDDDEEDESESMKAPRLHVRMLAHFGCINRIRAMPQQPSIVATWSEAGVVQIWDVQKLLDAVSCEDEKMFSYPPVAHQAPLKAFSGHQTEGFALDWSPVNQGWLASGDNNGVIHLWQPQGLRSWDVGGMTLLGHSSSVEDLQWSPVNEYELASCSSDGTLCIWDIRTCTSIVHVKIHDTDANVISWSRKQPDLIASGGDDGIISIWHRQFLTAGSAVSLRHHSAPITSIEWCPHEDPMLVATSADNTLSVWDLSLEPDPEEETQAQHCVVAPDNLPGTLLFVHQGQKDLKEVHWHPQLLGTLISTSFHDFNIFRPSNILASK